MNKSTAERQAAYRARQGIEGEDGNGLRRVRKWVRTGVAFPIARLAHRYGIRQCQHIENVLIAED